MNSVLDALDTTVDKVEILSESGGKSLDSSTACLTLSSDCVHKQLPASTIVELVREEASTSSTTEAAKAVTTKVAPTEDRGYKSQTKKVIDVVESTEATKTSEHGCKTRISSTGIRGHNYCFLFAHFVNVLLVNTYKGREIKKNPVQMTGFTTKALCIK